MPRRSRSRIAQLRRVAHRTSVALGDVRAVQTGRIPQRAVNRLIGRAASKLLKFVWR